jgi:hypothetical protein
MEELPYIGILAAIASAFGVKELWAIWKQKIQIKADVKEAYRNEIQQRILECEKKVEMLVNENTELSIKVARLEERILLTAKNRVKRGT